MCPVSLATQLLAPTSVSVGTSRTTVATFDSRYTNTVTVQIENTDATSVFVGRVERRLDPTMSFAPTTLVDFAAVGPGESVVADLDTQGTSEVRITGVMSDATGTVLVTARRRSDAR